MNIHCIHDSPVIWRKRVVLDGIWKIANYTAYEQVGETLCSAIVSSFVYMLISINVQYNRVRC